MLLITLFSPTTFAGDDSSGKISIEGFFAGTLNMLDAGNGNLAIIFISHNLNDTFEIADRIVILRQGRLVGERMINETNREEVVSLMVQG